MPKKKPDIFSKTIFLLFTGFILVMKNGKTQFFVSNICIYIYLRLSVYKNNQAYKYAPT